jgi:hypothetical protein
LPTGTVNYSTLRWDSVGADWIENTANRFNNNTWSTIAYEGTVIAPAALTTNIAYIAIKKGTGGLTLSSNASAIIASGTDNSLTTYVSHSGTGLKGYSALLGCYRCGINLESQTGGATIISSDVCFINSNADDTGTGFSSITASRQSQIFNNIEYNQITASDSVNISNGRRSVIFGSANSDIQRSSVGGVLNFSCYILGTQGGKVRANFNLLSGVPSEYSGLIGTNHTLIDSPIKLPRDVSR